MDICIFELIEVTLARVTFQTAASQARNGNIGIFWNTEKCSFL